MFTLVQIALDFHQTKMAFSFATAKVLNVDVNQKHFEQNFS